MNQPQHSLVPLGNLAPAAGNISEALRSLLDRAQEEILRERGDVVDDEEGMKAQIVHRMLAISEDSRTVQKVAQSYVVAYIARHQLWRFHPDGFRSLREFLQSTGLAHSTVVDFNALGEIVVPFCDAHDIPVNRFLSREKWSKLREAIPAIRRAISASDPDRVLEILDDVGKATNRDAIRAKYRRQRAKYGHATTVRLGDGRVLLVAILDDDESAETIVKRLGGGVRWDLVLGTNMIGDTLKVVLDG